MKPPQEKKFGWAPLGPARCVVVVVGPCVCFDGAGPACGDPRPGSVAGLQVVDVALGVRGATVGAGRAVVGVVVATVVGGLVVAVVVVGIHFCARWPGPERASEPPDAATRPAVTSTASTATARSPLT
jgi:hypothetical protein